MKQSFSVINNLLLTHGINPRNKLGQNFLIDHNTLDIVVNVGEVTREDAVLEVGPGTGILTQRLVEAAGFVLSVELDRRFAELICSQIPQGERFELHLGDILAGKNQIDPAVLGKLKEGGARAGCKRWKLVANLPYSVATPVLTNLLLGEVAWERLVGMVQWEIAERFVALPGTDHYGGLAALIASMADARIVRKVPPTVFYPRPKVDSAILEVRPNYEKRTKVEGRLASSPINISGCLAFRHFLRDLFVHRRKNVRGALIAMPDALPKPQVDALLADFPFPPESRAEDLDPATLLELCARWREKLSNGQQESESP